MKNFQDEGRAELITTVHNTPHFSPPVLDKFRSTDDTELQIIIMAGLSLASCYLDALPTALLKKTL